MKRNSFFILLALTTILITFSCQNKKKPEERKVIDISRWQQAVGSHYDEHGNSIDNNNVFAPRAGESDEEFHRRTGYGNSSQQNTPYEDGYEDGYQEGYQNAKSKFGIDK